MCAAPRRVLLGPRDERLEDGLFTWNVDVIAGKNLAKIIGWQEQKFLIVHHLDEILLNTESNETTTSQQCFLETLWGLSFLYCDFDCGHHHYLTSAEIFLSHDSVISGKEGKLEGKDIIHLSNPPKLQITPI